MPSRPTSALRVILAMFLTCAFVAIPASAHGQTAGDGSPRANARSAAGATSGWCAAEFENLGSDVCYIDGRKKNAAPAARKTLVIWLHGVIAKNSTWSYNHERMLHRVAKYTNIEVLFPHAPTASSPESVWAWPGTTESQAKTEEALIQQWMSAKTLLEKRDNRSFDEVFVFGFSSGAYFTSSLAMRGRVDVDGYATFAGGQSQPAAEAAVARFSPVFVGVCANDASTVNHSRAFAGALASAGIPRMVMEQKIGHDLSEVHFVNALSFLRSKAKRSSSAV
jgi:predicted esterase